MATTVDAPSQVKVQMSDAAVQAKTGKTWPEWFAILDAAGAQAMDHKGIVAHLHLHHPELGGWWEQMVTVTYEQARGLRAKHQKADGYQVSASKTVAAPLSAVYAAWLDETTRASWLPDAAFTVRKATPEKTLRFTWTDGQSDVEVRFSSKGETKSALTVQHSKLANQEEATRMKGYWGEALERLKDLQE
jgi:uncharacterized protein YndB with AHSA1/START domain